MHAYICMVYNIAMSDSCRARLRSIGTIDVFKPYLKSTDSDIQLEALATLAAITNEHESEIIKSNEQSVIVLMDTLRQGLKSVIRRSTLGKSRWSCEECALSKYHLLGVTNFVSNTYHFRVNF